MSYALDAPSTTSSNIKGSTLKIISLGLCDLFNLEFIFLFYEFFFATDPSSIGLHDDIPHPISGYLVWQRSHFSFLASLLDFRWNDSVDEQNGE